MTAQEAGGILKVHQRMGKSQGAGLNMELSVNKHRKGSEDLQQACR
jgi:hypothetical protein